jgi:hypothetical protein
VKQVEDGPSRNKHPAQCSGRDGLSAHSRGMGAKIVVQNQSSKEQAGARPIGGVIGQGE